MAISIGGRNSACKYVMTAFKFSFFLNISGNTNGSKAIQINKK